jgi:hypothetical protein
MVGVREGGLREAWLAGKRFYKLVCETLREREEEGDKRGLRGVGREVAALTQCLYSWCLNDTVVFLHFLYVQRHSLNGVLERGALV